MNSLGHGLRILILTLISCLLAVPAMGWEFSMRGEFNWCFFAFSQLGTAGFFGPHDVDRGTFGSAGNINFWHGKRLAVDENGPDLVSGADASGQYTHTTISPQIRFNEAVRLRGQYRIGSWAWTGANTLAGNGAPVGVRVSKQSGAGTPAIVFAGILGNALAERSDTHRYCERW